MQASSSTFVYLFSHSSNSHQPRTCSLISSDSSCITVYCCYYLLLTLQLPVVQTKLLQLNYFSSWINFPDSLCTITNYIKLVNDFGIDCSQHFVSIELTSK